jgi:DNA-binding GntR family transcriptional regulator
MRREHQKMMAALEADDWAEALNRDEALLAVLYEASGNDVLVELIRGLWQRCRAYKLLGVRVDGGGARKRADPEVWSFQEPLIAAAADHDTAAAVKITEQSLTSATARIKAMLDGG